MNEIEIKVRLVEVLVKKYPKAIIAAEVPFLFGERRADIVMLEGDIATVFEIKSAQDTTSRLAGQLENYKSFFDFCYVVCEPCNIKEIRKIIPTTVGIIKITNDKIVQHRKSHQFKRLDKLTLLSIFPVHTLKNLVKSKSKSSQIDLAKALIKTQSLIELKKLNRDYLRSNYQHSFELMKTEIGAKITADDIHTISQRIPRFF